MQFTKYIAIALLCAPLAAQAIGRSGNGRIQSVQEGFSTIQPLQLPEFQAADDGSIRLMNSGIMDAMHTQAALYAHRFSVFYPTRTAMDRDTLKLDFASNGWRQSAAPQDQCIDLYYSDRGSATAVVAVWGMGKGVVLVGPKLGVVAYAIDQMIQNLQLDPGACAWK